MDRQMTTDRVLQTPRLILRPLALEQADDLFHIYNDAETLRYWHTLPHQNPIETSHMIASMLGGCHWTVFTRETSQAIGVVGHLDSRIPGMGYIIRREDWRKGYGLEAVGAALEYGFTSLKLNRVELWIHAANIASVSLAQKAGFRQRGQFYQRYSHHAEPHETLVFGLRAEEWATRYNHPGVNRQREIAFFGVNPAIQVANVGETIAFYRDKLGFAVDYVGGSPPDFAILSRGEWSTERAQIHFGQNASPSAAGELYLSIGLSADRLCDEFRTRGVTISSGLETKPYGRREFSIIDNNGWRLTFSSAV
jgi:ribosomal-protein-alanine N-acetyltransferase